MAYSCPEDCCVEYAVTPMLTPKYCEGPAVCYPSYVCLPRCPKGQVVYCCEKQPPCCEKRAPCGDDDECCGAPPPHPRQTCKAPPRCCPTCCRPMKTKYVMPCYRYEDGRIEQYVPTRHGRLPKTAYQRNGIQDQIHGYRGAVRYLCADENAQGCCIYTAVEPIKKLFPKITQEMLPVKRKKDKK